MDNGSRAMTQVLDALRIMRKHWTWILACAAAACAATAAWTWTRPPVYEAAALIEVEPRANPLVDDRAGAFETHRYLLKGRPMLEKAAETLDLAGTHGVTNGYAFLESRVFVDHIPETEILRIRARASEPELARDIANTLARAYVREDADRRVQASKRLLSWLQEQMVDIKAQVEDSEMALIQYVETAQLDLVDVSGEGSNGSDELAGSPVLRDYHLALGKDELALEHALLDYTEAHPDVIRLKNEIRILKEKIAEERKRIATENKKRIRYEMLRRDAQLNREMFAVFMREMKRVNLMGDDPVERIQVHEEAVAPPADHPIAPRKGQNMLLGTLAGLLLGIGFAFLHESLDRTLKRPDEIEEATGLPILATVHRKVLPKGQERFLVEPTGTWGRELEDFRALRTSLRYARAESENHVLEITSALPQEGKTTVVTNLAMVMGQAGERVLIVDADLRRPAVHAALAIDNDRGLTNLLAEGVEDPLSVVRKTEFPNVFVVTAGAHAPNPPELLESDAMKMALEIWRNEFDRIIIDTPPVGGVVDPRILAPLVDGVALLVSTGRADAETVRAARAELDQVGARFFGVVVNQLAKGGDGYGYGYGYGYYYGTREPARDEDEDREAASG